MALISAIVASRRGEQCSIAAPSYGILLSLLSGGLQLRTLWSLNPSRLIPARCRFEKKKCPAFPTRGIPSLASCSPAASATTKTPFSPDPEAGTYPPHPHDHPTHVLHDSGLFIHPNTILPYFYFYIVWF